MFNKKKELPKRRYHDGDIIEFDFESNSFDIECHEVTIMGVISGVIHKSDGIYYKVDMGDNKRKIYGEFIIHEELISGKIEADNV